MHLGLLLSPQRLKPDHLSYRYVTACVLTRQCCYSLPCAVIWYFCCKWLSYRTSHEFDGIVLSVFQVLFIMWGYNTGFTGYYCLSSTQLGTQFLTPNGTYGFLTGVYGRTLLSLCWTVQAGRALRSQLVLCALIMGHSTGSTLAMTQVCNCHWHGTICVCIILSAEIPYHNVIYTWSDPEFQGIVFPILI